jgi:hypothetical protein
MSDIFLSYASEDLPRVRPIVQALEHRGWSVWWDRTMLPGDTYDQVIDRAIQEAKCVIVVWSRTSVDSEWVRAEADEGRQRGILIPVMIDEVRIPLSFRQMHAAHLMDWRETEPHQEFDTLVRAMTNLLGPSPLGEQAEAADDTPIEPPREREAPLPHEKVSEPHKSSADRVTETITSPGGNKRALVWGAVVGVCLLGLLIYFAILSRDTPQRPPPSPQVVKTYRLTIHTTPSDSTIKMLNTDAAYRPGVKLEPGQYDILVERDGYIPVRRHITIAHADVLLNIALAISPKPSEPKTIRNSIGMEFVLIPAGEFRMGSTKGDSDERPVHAVTISTPFYLGKHEVTQAQWEEVMRNNPSRFTGDPNRPVEQVSWEDVQAFIRKLNEKEGGTKYRLPTEAEWEYAARAGSTTAYSFGDDRGQLGEYGWYWDNSDKKTHPVGQLKPNVWGLYDYAWQRLGVGAGLVRGLFCRVIHGSAGPFVRLEPGAPGWRLGRRRRVWPVGVPPPLAPRQPRPRLSSSEDGFVALGSFTLLRLGSVLNLEGARPRGEAHSAAAQTEQPGARKALGVQGRSSWSRRFSRAEGGRLARERQ